jgi:hypothetical protein
VPSGDGFRADQLERAERGAVLAFFPLQAVIRNGLQSGLKREQLARKPALAHSLPVLRVLQLWPALGRQGKVKP